MLAMITESNNAVANNIAKQISDKKAADEARKEEAKKLQQEKQSRIAVAQATRNAFAAQASGLTNRLHQLIDAIPLLEKEWTDFLKGESGRVITRFPELVQSASMVVSQAKIPQRSLAVAKLEGIRGLIDENSARVNTEAQPSTEEQKALETARDWAVIAEEGVENINSGMKSLKDLARRKVVLPETPPEEQSLAVAIEKLRFETIDGINRKLVAATNQAIEIRTSAATNDVIKIAEIERQKKAEELRRRQAEAKAEIEKQNLIAEAQSFETRQILAPFITPGIIDANNATMREKGPHSWAQLQRIINSSDPHRRFNDLASKQIDVYRPRWGKAVVSRNADAYEQADQAIKTLRRLGPILVELKMLNP